MKLEEDEWNRRKPKSMLQIKMNQKGRVRMGKIDINSDIGESFGVYQLGMDEEILQYVSSVNIACGWHGGDPMVMKKLWSWL